MKNILLYFLLIIFVAVLGFTLSPVARHFLLNLGFIGEVVPISGTGSMYPTFPKIEGVTDEVASKQTVAQPEMKRYPRGIKIFGKNFFTYRLKRGDIAEFENELTRKITKEKYGLETGFIKRIIALSGDEIELRDGYVQINGKIIKESYTAKPRSTYGGDFAPDCKKIKIPEGSAFVLGDNRKASLDSRFDIGFVRVNDIHHVLSLDDQQPFQKNWRDTKDDLKYAHTASADSGEFVKILNLFRKQKNLSLLKLNTSLNKSSSFRGRIILDTNDFTTEATRSGLNLEKAVKDAGYKNIVFAEAFTRGYFEASELLENLFEFPDSKKLLTSEDYQDIGLSIVLGNIYNCPTIVSIIHLGGYKAPSYEKKDVENWGNLIKNLTEIMPSWKNLLGAENINQDKLRSLISLLEERLKNASRIYQRLSNNEWLSDEENAMLGKDKTLHVEAEKLIGDLNK